LMADRDYFVITTNVDCMFAKSGFAEERIFTPQGNYALFQCLTPCTRETWPFKPVIDRILPTIDPATQEITDPSVIPHCPNCGGPVMMNVRGGDWFIDEPYLGQYRRYVDWVNASAAGRLLILEFGSGFNTPGVIRWPMEDIADRHPDAHLIRVNRDYPQVPAELGDKAMGVQARSVQVINTLVARNAEIKGVHTA
jgi:NAD-dependent SIR2 family protein deacetylase